MVSSHGSSTHSEAAMKEQIITEFFAKSLHIILESRSPFASSSRNYSGGDQAPSSPSSSASTSSSSSVRPRDKWFNLALRDCPSALENIDFWRHGNLELVVVDVVLLQRPAPGLVWHSDPEEFGSEKIIERWVVRYESQKNSRDGGCSSGSGSRRSATPLPTLYKKSILLLRSLYLTVRLLPAYKLFRDLNSCGRIHTFTLAPRVFSFVEPFTSREESEMQQFGFAPVDTLCGRLCLSVTYRPSLSDMIPSGPSTPMTPRVIPDYVGSPIADPIKRFPSLPTMGYGFPASPYCRPHSWSHDFHNAMPPPMSLPPPRPSETSLTLKKNVSFDEYWASLNNLPAPSPSSPICISGSHPSRAILRSESAPIRIPAVRAINSPALESNQILAPSPFFRGSRQSSSKAGKCMGPMETGAAVEKVIHLGRDESGKSPGVKSSCNSTPWLSASRSPHISSMQDDLDELGYDCPFIEDDDMTDPVGRVESYDRRVHVPVQIEPGRSVPVKKSPQAAVGAVVLMLNKAPPLRQDFSNSNIKLASKPGTSDNICEPHRISGDPVTELAPSSIVSSGAVTSKTTAMALEELRGYRETKEMLLSKSSKSLAR